MMIQIGDIVTIKSYRNDDLWRVIDICQQGVEIAKLKGLTNRSIIRTPTYLLTGVNQQNIRKTLNNRQLNDQWAFAQFLQKKRSSMNEFGNNIFYKNPGKVLHLDGAEEYVNDCIGKYKELGISANGYFINSSEMSKKVAELLEKHQPDILIITGHDGYDSSKDMYSLDSYYNSKDYVETVKEARKYYNKNNLIIFAGACYSYFEALMAAGANFASSPTRVSIDIYDPVIVADRVAFTPLLQKADLMEVIFSTKYGMGSIGGIDTEGCMRNSIPSINAPVPRINAPNKYVTTHRQYYPHPMFYSQHP
ncbi:sporulation peptidase YabG [Acetivibrio cellulolyticus]|uniref:sporulation peptidase YabG n=1 Tax=Acetivibrio cellulolyticus TaxID=35830 RepID=UPI0001E2D87C|nr:sporulation peptidase YabG [Acetivibrio cellulolyticus]